MIDLQYIGILLEFFAKIAFDNDRMCIVIHQIIDVKMNHENFIGNSQHNNCAKNMFFFVFWHNLLNV